MCPIGSFIVTWPKGLWYLTLFSTIYRLYRGGQFYWWRNFITWCCIEYTSPRAGLELQVCLFVCLMVFNATFNNISVISWRSVLLVEETGGPGENHRPAASHWQTLSHNVVSHMTLDNFRCIIRISTILEQYLVEDHRTIRRCQNSKDLPISTTSEYLYAETGNTIICWDRKHYYMLRQKTLLYAETGNTIICWDRKYYYMLRQEILVYAETGNTIICWDRKYYYMLRQETLLLSR